MPLMTSLLSAYWTRSETLTGRKVAGILVGIVGTALLFWPHEHLGLQQTLGMLAALGGCLSATINLVTMKKYGRHSDPFVLNFLGMGLGTACLLAHERRPRGLARRSLDPKQHPGDFLSVRSSGR